jgi:hypothetical protein
VVRVSKIGRGSLGNLFSVRNIVLSFYLLVAATATSLAEPTYRPNLYEKLVELEPPKQWGKFVVPVSIHLSCQDDTHCAQRPGTVYSEAYFSRLLSIMSRDYQPPPSSFFFRGGYRGVEFVLAHFDRVVSPGLYAWNESGDHDGMVNDLIAKGNPYIEGYFNVFVTGPPLCGVTGVDQDLNRTLRIFVGVGCLGDDDVAHGIYGSAVLEHEAMHALGMGHIVEGTASESIYSHPECGTEFKYKCYDGSHSVIDGNQHFHPERNHFMGSNTTGLGALEAFYGRPSFFTFEAYSTSASDQTFEETADSRLFFPARFDFATETILACWAYRNFIVDSAPSKIPSLPLIKLTTPTVPGQWLPPSPQLVQAEIIDWNGATLREASFGLDRADAAPLTLVGTSTKERGITFHFQGLLDLASAANGPHELQVKAVDSNGMTGWQSLPINLLRPVARGCLRFEGCVDGKDVILLTSGKVKVQHESFSTMGTGGDCADYRPITNNQASLFQPGTGVFLLDGKSYPAAKTVALTSGPTRANRVEVIMARGSVRFDGASASVILDDEATNGAAPYVVDICE